METRHREGLYNFEPPLSETLDSLKAGKKPGFILGNPDHYMKIEGSVYDSREEIEQAVWSFAGDFEGQENYNDGPENPRSPLEVPLQQYLDFFAFAEKSYASANEEHDSTMRLNFPRRGRLNYLRNTVGDAAEIAAEALVYAIADHLSDGDRSLAKLLGRLEGRLEAEAVAEEAEDDATTAYAMTASNPSAATGALVNMSSAGDAETGAEERRVATSNQVVEAIRPVLENLQLDKYIDEWIVFSN